MVLVPAILPYPQLVATGGPGIPLEADSSLEFTNAGPLPVQVRNVSTANTQGITIVQRFGDAITVPPAQTNVVDVHVTISCEATSTFEPIPLSLIVRTADRHNRRRTIDLRVRGTSWADLRLRLCK